MDINLKQIAVAGLLGSIPAIGAYFLISIAAGANSAGSIIAILGIAGFGYLMYQKPTLSEKGSSMFFILSLELLISPLIFLIYTFVFTAENTATDAGAAGAAIGGIVLVGVSFLIGVPLAGGFYLVSRRLGS